MTYKETACAKLNLALDIIRKRPDGYHDMRMVMQSISLCDTVTIAEKNCAGIDLYTDLSFLPKDGSNIAVKAAGHFFRETGITPRGLEITLEHLHSLGDEVSPASRAALEFLNRNNISE